MKLFEQHNPRSPKSGRLLLHYFESPEKKNGYDFYFLKEVDYFLVYAERFHTFPETSDKAGKTKLIADQFEIPMAGIRWFIDVIEQKFFKPPEEGGLPAHKLSYEEIVAGEDLHVMRSMRGGTGAAGYVITNSSRRSHLAPRNSQTMDFSDTWLFENGLMDYLKELADLYEQGKL